MKMGNGEWGMGNGGAGEAGEVNELLIIDQCLMPNA
jgi:hypothetical protein